MPDVERASPQVTCQCCRTPMKLDVYIAPIGKSEGLATYTCPTCDRLESKFVPPRV